MERGTRNGVHAAPCSMLRTVFQPRRCWGWFRTGQAREANLSAKSVKGGVAGLLDAIGECVNQDIILCERWALCHGERPGALMCCGRRLRMSHGAPMSHAFAWCIVSDILFCGQGWTRARIICHIVCYIPTFGKLCSVLFHGTSVHPYRYRTARTARPHPRTCIGGGCHAHRVSIPSHTYMFYSICSLLHTKYTYSCNPVL